MRVTRRFELFAAAVMIVAACSATPKHRIAVAMVVDGDRAKVGTPAPHAVAGLELQPFAVPAPVTPPPDDSAAVVAKARAAYVDGNFDACRTELARIDLGKLLAAGQRALAGRTIAFDAACAYGAQAKELSLGLALKLARMGLELPDAPFARDEEMLIARALEEVGKAPRHALAVGGLAGARLFVDGRSTGCTLPCTIEVPAGDHFVAIESDGYMPSSRWLHVKGPASLDLTPPAASPAVATEQWRARIGRGLPANDAIGAKLLAQLSGQPRVVFLHGGERVAGTMIVDGEIRASGERAESAPLIRELAYDANVLKRPALWQQPKFWIATSIIVAVVASVTIYAVYEPDVESNLRF